MSLQFFQKIDQFIESRLFEDVNTNNSTSGKVTNNSTSGQAAAIDPTKSNELQKKLVDWSETFGGIFKFKYDHPKNGDASLEKFDTGTDYISKLKSEIETPEGINDNYPDKAVEAVKKLAEILNAGDYTNIPVYVIGHCSSPGSDQYNMDLSGRRSRLVKYALASQIAKDKYNVNKLFAKADGEKNRIITNDDKPEDGQDALFNNGVDSSKLITALGKDSLKKFSVKSLINQRVQVSVKYPAAIVTPDQEAIKPEANEEKSSPSNLLIDPTAIDFLPNSYLMKTESVESILKPFADKVNKAGAIVKSLFIVGHAENGEEKGKYDRPNEIKGLFVLSLNRGASVREKLENLITVKDITYSNIGCGMELSDDYTDFEKAYKDTPRPTGNKVVEVFVNFEPKTSKDVYQKLSNEYGVKTSESILNNPSLLITFVYNVYMKVYGTDRESILANIPLEFKKDQINPHIQEAIDNIEGLMAQIDAGTLLIPAYKQQIEDKMKEITEANFNEKPKQ